MMLSIPVGFMAADSIGAPGGDQAQVENTGMQPATVENVTVRQGDACFDVVPFTSNDTVVEFYDYRTPLPDNEYTNATGQSYSSEGTTELQEPNGSVLFFHQDPTGNLSLVAVHGALNDTSQGGAVSFDVAGLPENGTWAVKDDEYDDESSIDNWTHGDGNASIDWTWGEARTDGFAFAGLGDEFEITIDPAFDENATLSQDDYDGSVENWTVLSNETTSEEGTGATTAEDTANDEGNGTMATDGTAGTASTHERTDLNVTGTVNISTVACDDGSQPGGGAVPPEPAGGEDDDDSGATTDDETDGTVGDSDADDESDAIGDTTDENDESDADDAGEPGDEAADDDEGDGEPNNGGGADGEPDDGGEADGEPDDGDEDDEGPGDGQTDGDGTGDDADDGDGAAGSGNSPAVNAVIWDRIGASDDFDVEWTVSDTDGDLSDVTVELYDGGSLVDSASDGVNGGSAVGGTQVSGSADSVRVVVTDEQGNQDEQSYGIGPPPESDEQDASAGDDGEENPDDGTGADEQDGGTNDGADANDGDGANEDGGDAGASVASADTGDEQDDGQNAGDDEVSDDEEEAGDDSDGQDEGNEDQQLIQPRG